MLNSMGQFAFIEKYFPGLTANQIKQFEFLPELYQSWNEKVNLISRKDIEQLMERHVLHSLAVAKVVRFNEGARVMDVGTGGGFPGIPLAILNPNVKFFLIDSIEKKIKAVQDIVLQLGLTNVDVIRGRAEEQKLKLDYVVSRAAAPMSDLVSWTRSQLISGQEGSLPNGWIVLKGGDLREELQPFGKLPELYPINDFFPSEVFEQKVVVYLARQIL